jgi:hypothetical protein
VVLRQHVLGVARAAGVPVSNYLAAGAVAAGGLATAYFIVRYVKRCLRRGWVSYGGNSINTRSNQRYDKKVTPGMYWFGIVMYSAMAVGCVVLAAFICVTFALA